MHIFILASTMYVVGAVAESLAIYQLRKRAAVIEATLGALKDPSGGKRAAGIFRQRVAPKPASAAAGAAGGSVGGGAGAGLELTQRMAGGEGAAEAKYTPGVGQPAAGADGAVEESELDLVTESLGEQAPAVNAASAPTGGGADGDAAGSAAGGKGIAAAAVAPAEVQVAAAAPRVGCWDCVLSWLTKHLDNVSLVVFPVSYAIVTAALFSTSDEPT